MAIGHSPACRIVSRRDGLSQRAPLAEPSGEALHLLEHHWQHVRSFRDVSDARTFNAFSAAYRRLEEQALVLGMPADCDDAVDWAESFLALAADTPAFTPGTPEHRARHISMLWSAQLWHEAVLVLAVIVVAVLWIAALRECGL